MDKYAVAEMLDISTRQLYRLVRDKHQPIPHTRDADGKLAFDAARVREWVEAGGWQRKPGRVRRKHGDAAADLSAAD